MRAIQRDGSNDASTEKASQVTIYWPRTCNRWATCQVFHQKSSRSDLARSHLVDIVCELFQTSRAPSSFDAAGKGTPCLQYISACKNLKNWGNPALAERRMGARQRHRRASRPSYTDWQEPPSLQDWRSTSPTVRSLKENADRFRVSLEAVRRGLHTARFSAVSSGKDAKLRIFQYLKARRFFRTGQQDCVKSTHGHLILLPPG